LRSVPSKLNGVILMFGSLLILLVFPFIQFGQGAWSARKKVAFIPVVLMSSIQGAQFNSLHLFFVSNFTVVFILLGWLGGKPAVEPFTSVSL